MQHAAATRCVICDGQPVARSHFAGTTDIDITAATYTDCAGTTHTYE